jgi:hypothetical protein
VEQKNWSVVRRFAGYARFEGQSACRMLNRLYAVLRDYVNFFMPTMKCVSKTRDGSRVTKRYEVPKTPYQRVLDSPNVDAAVKQQLEARYRTLNLAELHRDILRFQDALGRLTASVDTSGRVRSLPGAMHPWRQPVCIQGARP